MIDIEKMIKKCEEISGRLEGIVADPETLGAIDEAIDIIHELLQEYAEQRDKLELTDSLYKAERDRSTALSDVLAKEFGERDRRRLTGEKELEGKWLKQLKLMIDAWESEVAAAQYMKRK